MAGKVDLNRAKSKSVGVKSFFILSASLRLLLIPEIRGLRYVKGIVNCFIVIITNAKVKGCV